MNAIVPPFQNPDEPHHFAAAAIYARGETARADVEIGVIRMMDKANWWRLEGIGRPVRLPARLSDIAFLMEGSKADDFRARLSRFEFWHRVAGRLMRPAAGASLEFLYYACRAVSSLLLLVAFVFLWKTFGLLAAAYGRAIRWGFVFVLALPQFLLTATAVSPDAFVVLICAAFFYVAAGLISAGSGLGRRERGWVRGIQAVFVVLLPAAAFVTDRSAIVLVPLALFTALLVVRRENAGLVVPGILIGVVAAVLAAYFIAVRFPLDVERIMQNVIYVFKGSGKIFPGLFDVSNFALRFWAFIADGFLLKFGWLVFGAPAWIYWMWRMLPAAAVFGLAVGLARWIQVRRNPDAAPEAARFRVRWTALAIAAVGIQAVGVWVFYGANGQFGQGRYFFPVVAPVAFLLVRGLYAFGELLKRGAGRKLLAGTVLAEVLLLTYAIWMHIIPAFHLILRGPHPGV